MNSMKIILLISIICLSFHVDAQIKNKNAKVPSYFGLRVCPVFPTQFIGEKSLSLTQGADETVKINTSITQKIGYSLFKQLKFIFLMYYTSLLIDFFCNLSYVLRTRYLCDLAHQNSWQTCTLLIFLLETNSDSTPSPRCQ